MSDDVWKSVYEELPGLDVRVICYSKSTDTVGVGWLSGRPCPEEYTHYVWVTFGCEDSVTHWASIPETP